MGRLFHAIVLRIVQLGSLLAVGLTAHTFVNSKLLKQASSPGLVFEKVSILLPVLNEASRVAPTLQSILSQQNLQNLEFIIRDDGSDDGTVALIQHMTKHSTFEVKLIEKDIDTPDGWISKSWSCQKMAEESSGSVLVFIDADVTFAPDAISRAVRTLRELNLSLISPYPKQIALTWSERLIQPLLQWSWLTFLPLGIAKKSSNPALAAANGQFLVVDREMYFQSGGHAATPADVFDDIALLRAIKTAGGKGVVIDGTDMASTRMYRNSLELTNGYAKSLWSAFGGRTKSRVLMGVLSLIYIVPAVAALTKTTAPIRRAGAVGYLAGILGRVITANRTGAKSMPDAISHPISIASLAILNEYSWIQRVRGKLRWRGRKIP